MRTAALLVGGALALVAAFFGIVILASESGEVVTLHTRTPAGDTRVTRLWVVDYAGAEWVRTGHEGKGWFVDVMSNPDVTIERSGSESQRIAVPVREKPLIGEVNEVFAMKYGQANEIVALSGDASKRIPVRLDPAPR